MSTSNTEGTLEPMVSIGLPVFNGEATLERALESILLQEHSSFELIVSDNGSTDRTAQICESFARRDSRVRYVRQEENIGATANFRYVLQAARNDRFIWAAADDWWEPDRLKLLVAHLTAGDAVVVGRIRRWFENQLIAEYVPVGFGHGNWWRYLLREESRCEKVYFIYGLMWRNQALLAFSDVADRYWEDAIFCYRLLWCGDLKSIPGATLNVSISRTSSGGLAAEGYRQSVSRLLYRAHPWSYYKRYLASTPRDKLAGVKAAIPLKIIAAQMHLWFRAFRRLFLRKPFVHGAVAEGEKTVMRNRI